VNHSAQAFANAYVELTPIKGLSIKSTFNVDGTYRQNRSYIPRYVVSNIQTDTTQRLTKVTDQILRYELVNTVTYERVFENHRLKIMGGMSSEQERAQNLTGSSTGVPFFSESTLYLSNGSLTGLSVSDEGSMGRRASIFGRLFYSYRDKYLFTGTLRRDGSSRYPKEERWGYFPSLGLGWVLSEESFMQNSNVFDFFKLRASWGILGNDNIPFNASIVTVDNWGGYSIVYGPWNNTNISQGASITSVVEPLLKWEIVEEYDAGLEVLLLDSRLNIEFDFYRRMTKDAIFPVPLIGTSGTAGGSYWDNNADILNTGVELTMSWNNKISENFSYSFGGNISTNHNEVYKLQEGTLPFYDGGVFNGNLATYTQEGHPIGEFYVYETIGVFQDMPEVENYKNSEGIVIMPDAGPGDLKFKDQNDDGIIDNFDRKSYGSYTPTLLYAFRFGLDVRQFDFSVDFQGVGGNKIYNAKRANRFGNESWDADFVENRWHGPGTSNDYPSSDVAGGKNAFPSSFFIESGAYFRVRNIQLGYTIPLSITNRINAGLIRIYATAQNPFTFFKYNGFSPEIPGGFPSTQGIDNGVYPLSRITSIGVNINF
jgi:TonB-linked SusC/RagA family outer membrane protein